VQAGTCRLNSRKHASNANARFQCCSGAAIMQVSFGVTSSAPIVVSGIYSPTAAWTLILHATIPGAAVRCRKRRMRTSSWTLSSATMRELGCPAQWLHDWTARQLCLAGFRRLRLHAIVWLANVTNLWRRDRLIVESMTSIAVRSSLLRPYCRQGPDSGPVLGPASCSPAELPRPWRLTSR